MSYMKQLMVAVVCVFALHPLQTAMVMSGWSVNLTTPFLGRLRPPMQLN